MIVIKIDFLAGRYTAHSPKGYGTREWPPHPSRFYSALVAAYHEHDHGEDERQALKWLETLPAPRLCVPDAHTRDTVTFFVPHYDHKKITQQGGEIELIPEYRSSSNKARTFPTVIPEGPFYFIWDGNPDDKTRTALNRLATSVPYFGDSSSLVHAQVVEKVPEPNVVPATNQPGEEHLRVTGPGRLEALEEAYNVGRRPQPTGQVEYTSSGLNATGRSGNETSDFGTSDDFLILRIIDGPRLPLEVAHDLTTSIRRAILAIVDDPIPEWISGHTTDGAPSDETHVAFVPLANVGHTWADGSVLGLAIVIPRHVSVHQKQTLYQAIEELRPIGLGSRGSVELERVISPVKESLKRDGYTGSSTLWTTVTPYIYDRYPNSDDDRIEIIAQACRHIGLPDPEAVKVIEHGVSPLQGVPRAQDTQLNGTRFSDRPRKHVIIRFSEPVEGPIIIGRGRYLGIGLMQSIKREAST